LLKDIFVTRTGLLEEHNGTLPLVPDKRSPQACLTFLQEQQRHMELVLITKFQCRFINLKVLKYMQNKVRN
jgi:hypothetical protein